MYQRLLFALLTLVSVSVPMVAEAQPETRARTISSTIPWEEGVVTYRDSITQQRGYVIAVEGERGERYIIYSGSREGIPSLRIRISFPVPARHALSITDLGLDDYVDVVRVLGPLDITAPENICSDSCGEWQSFYEALLDELILVFPPKRI
jgi:hypothetical protein